MKFGYLGLIVFISLVGMGLSKEYQPKFIIGMQHSNTYGITYIVYGNKTSLLLEFTLTCKTLDNIFKGKQPTYNNKPVAITLVCSPASYEVFQKGISRSKELSSLIAKYQIKITVMTSPNSFPEGKMWRFYGQRYYAMAKYTMFLDLDAQPMSEFLSTFDYLTEEGYDIVVSMDKMKYGQSKKMGLSHHAGYIPLEKENEFLDFGERNGGVIVANMNSLAVLNFFTLENEIAQTYMHTHTHVGEQFAMRVALFVATRMWKGPYRLEEKTLDWETEFCRSTIMKKSCLFDHNRHPHLVEIK